MEDRGLWIVDASRQPVAAIEHSEMERHFARLLIRSICNRHATPSSGKRRALEDQHTPLFAL
jgi:hypothetical protein